MVVLIEHQTTINPNMPLRFLSYVDELYRRYISTFHENIYKREWFTGEVLSQLPGGGNISPPVETQLQKMQQL